MGKVKNNNYINIQGWMVTDLKLKGNDLLIYAIIYGFTQDGEQWFDGSRQYLAEWCNSTTRGISKNLGSLVKKGYLLKEDIVINNVKFCKYKAIVNCSSAGNKVHGGEEQSSLPPREQSSPNNSSNNKTSNNNLDKESIRVKETVDYQGIVDMYNETCVSLPSVRSLTDKRKRALKVRLKNFSIEDLKTVFQKAEKSSFLNGSSDKWSGATFDWLIKEDNIVKVLEGNYDDKPKQQQLSRSPIGVQKTYTEEDYAEGWD